MSKIMQNLIDKFFLYRLLCVISVVFLYANVTNAEAHEIENANDVALLSIEDKSNNQAKTIFLTRHFEKEISSHHSQIDKASAGHKKDPNLTDEGQKRALALASYLADKNITAVFSTNYQRTMQTAKPTAAHFGIVISEYNPRKLGEFASTLLKMPATNLGNTLVVGHSNTTPELLKLLGGPETVLGEDDYGDLFMLEFMPVDGIEKPKYQRVLIE